MSQSDLIIEPDLVVIDGDIAAQQANESDSAYIIFAQKGQLRRNPLLGVGILDFINAPQIAGRDLAKAIRQEHDRDGYRLDTFEIQDNGDGTQELFIKSERVRQ